MWILVFLSKFHNVSGTCTIWPKIHTAHKKKKLPSERVMDKPHKKKGVDLQISLTTLNTQVTARLHMSEIKWTDCAAGKTIDFECTWKMMTKAMVAMTTHPFNNGIDMWLKICSWPSIKSNVNLMQNELSGWHNQLTSWSCHQQNFDQSLLFVAVAQSIVLIEF